MATETLKVKTQEVDSLLKEKVGVSDSEKEIENKEDPIKDDTETKTKEEEKGEGNEENSTPEKEAATPLSERPTRERKKTERYILYTSSRSSGSKPVSIEQGRGTRLREIPNVAYKLSKRKPDDNLFLLHTILFGKKGKAQMLKKNIGQFSGFVWSEQEGEKQRAKAKEKLEKCIKEKLIDFCDVLDIPINKSNVKKEELAEALLEFLVYPKATRDIVLADSENKTKKRKKSSPKSMTSGGESSDVPAKRRRQTKNSGKKKDQTSETEEANDEGDVGTNESHGEEDDAAPENENNGTETKDEKDKAEEKTSTDNKSSLKRTKKEKPASEEEKSLKGSAKSTRKSSRQVDKSTSSSSKKQKVEKDDSSKEKGKKQTSTKGSKDQGKASKRGKTEPTRREMQIVVVKILKEVDFNTATLSDILQQLGSHFGVDLMHRKTEVKDIITDAIDNMSDDENTEDEAEKEKKDKTKKN